MTYCVLWHSPFLSPAFCFVTEMYISWTASLLCVYCHQSVCELLGSCLPLESLYINDTINWCSRILKYNILHVSFTGTSSHVLILKRNVKGLPLFKIYCLAQLLVSSTMSCTITIPKMLSNSLKTSSSELWNRGPHISQNVSHEVGNKPIFFQTNLLDTPFNLKFTFSSFLFITTIITLTVTRFLESPNLHNLCQNRNQRAN
jgi:hypothetical protein